MGRESTTPSLSNSGFDWFQNNNSLAQTINLAPEWPPVNPKIAFGVVGEQCLLCISPAELTATDRKGIDDSLPMELVNRWVSESIRNYLQPTIYLTRIDPIQSKMTFGVVDKRYLLCIVPTELDAIERKILDNSLVI